MIKVQLGVELEVEIRDNPEQQTSHTSDYTIYGSYPKHHPLGNIHKKNGNMAKIVDELTGDKIKTHYDNTVDGCEWVGDPMSFKENLILWTAILTHPKIAPYIHGEDVKVTDHEYGIHDAGMHVHVSSELVTPLVLGRILEFINKKTNKSFIEYIAGRKLNKFCETYPQLTAETSKILYHTDECKKTTKRGKKIIYHYNHQYDNTVPSGGYCCQHAQQLTGMGLQRGAIWPLPMGDTGDFEVRIFKSTVKPERLQANLEFCVALIDYFSEFSDTSTEAFSKWISKSVNGIKYRPLFRFMRAGGFASGLLPKSREIAA